MHCLGMREASIHMWWMPRSETEIPYANQEHIEEDSRQYQLRIPNQYEEENVD
jgi:hypothetical protein